MHERNEFNSVPVQYSLPVLEWSETFGVFGVVELSVVEASFIDAL